jgi:3-deoxy-D-manno-octulosonate 8-phosphate phosphatase (KDO 8-P phosphatase)
MFDARLTERLRDVRCLAMDVDGVLTDGRIVWAADAAGGLVEIKAFNVRDGLGLSLCRDCGLSVVWITGRVSPIVERRAAELGVAEVVQWARNKRLALQEVSLRGGLAVEQVLYVADDLNDLPAFEAAGVRVAVADAALEVRQRADWVTSQPGGGGAVREVVEGVLQAQERWSDAVRSFLLRLEAEHGAPAAQ